MLIFNILLQKLSKIKRTTKSNYIIFLGGIIMFILLVAIYFIEKGNGSTMFVKFWDAIWWGVITAATIGYGDKFPQTELRQAFAIIYIFLSLGIFAKLLSLIIDFIFINTQKKMTGTYKYNFKNHLVIFTRKDNEKILTNILNQIITENKNQKVIFVTEGIKDELSSNLTSIISSNENITWVSGNPKLEGTLDNRNVKESSTIILLNGINSDQTLSDLMFLKLKGIKSNIIIDTKDNLYDNLFKQAGADVVINTEEISSLLLTRSLTDKANVLIRELLDNREAYEIYLDELDSNKYLGKTLKELKIDFMDKNINIVSIYRNGKVIHDNSEILLKNDSVYYFSENRLDIK